MKNVLVIGDIIADVYRECTFKKMCPDAENVPAVVEHTIDVRPGGAANVALNLVALHADVRVVLIGEIDDRLARVVKQLSQNRVNVEFCAFADNVLSKERIIVDGQLSQRIDNKSHIEKWASATIEKQVERYLSLNSPDLIVLSDYAAGTLSIGVLEKLLEMRDKLLVDTKMSDLSVFGSFGQRTKLIKLNYSEWKTVVGKEPVPERFFKTMVVTKGNDGARLSIHSADDTKSYTTHTIDLKSHDVDVNDVCGCGDTFLAGLAASFLMSDDSFTAVQFANAAAATVVMQPRTSVASLELTLKLLNREQTK